MTAASAFGGVSPAGAGELLRRAGISGDRVHVQPVTSGHTVFRLVTGGRP